jgi:hypothetical protein
MRLLGSGKRSRSEWSRRLGFAFPFLGLGVWDGLVGHSNGCLGVGSSAIGIDLDKGLID